MNKLIHRVLFLFIVLLMIQADANAQQNRFIYLQTDNKQAFYVRMNDKVLSSSSSGYLIIPKLKDGVVSFTVGFPKNEPQPQNFTYTINKKDAGFLIKDFGEKGWGLFNLQSMEVVMAKDSKKQPVKQAETNEDAFSKVLSEVVNEPELNNKTIVEEEPVVVKQESVKKEPVKTEAVVVKTEPVAVKTEVREEPKPEVKKTEPVARVARLILNNSGKAGREMVYIDEYEGGYDTIRLFIPATEELVTPVVAKNNKTKKNEKEKKEEPAEKFLDIDLLNPNVKKDSVTVTLEPGPAPMINSDCKQNASDDDFLKLRKKMAAAEKEEKMIAEAKKGFKSRCYSSEQVKNLSVLFLNDAGRYNFFDIAYPRVYDSHNFGMLERQLTDPYYITRFQAMIRR